MSTVMKTRGWGFLSVILCLFLPLFLVVGVRRLVGEENLKGFAFGALGVAAFLVGAVVNYFVGRELNSLRTPQGRVWHEYHQFQGAPMQDSSWFFGGLVVVLGITRGVWQLTNGVFAWVVFLALSAACVAVRVRVRAAKGGGNPVRRRAEGPGSR
ncbi:hypothetical protein ACFXDJ_28025 [Streptomyces sp. NPDC059443]|uniref:hypothetical protein n=1 Tax=unclassified Streptomyces TaxID=2593676 RepID=UPI0036885B8F